MKKYITPILLFLAGIVVLSSCQKMYDKTDSLPLYANAGTNSVLTASSASIAPAVADSNNTVLTLNWTNPNYAVDSSTVKYIVEIDSTGRNFAKKITRTVIGKLNTTFTGSQIDSLFATFGIIAGKQASFDMRITSSYPNNNLALLSNVVTIKMTSYGVPIKLTPSSTSAIVLDVKNATSQAIAFNWNASPYGAATVYYALQVDTVGGNFANPQTIKYDGALTSSITVNDLNTVVMAAGVVGGATKNMEFRVVSYFGTDYSKPMVNSNTVVLNITTFTPVPSALYIVGGATPGSWSNPVPVPSQQLTRLDAVSYGITIYLNGGDSYLLLPTNGSWDQKYAVASSSANPMGDNFGYYSGAKPTQYNTNIPSPTTSGLYQIVVNFQTGKYTVTPSTTVIPANLYLVGGATDGGWANPVPVPSQQFTQIDASSFGIIANLKAGDSYLLLPVNGDWSHKYGGTSATGGALLADGAVPGSNTPSPATAGMYQIIVNFVTNTYTVTPYTGVLPVPTNLYIVGDATPGGWSNPVSTPDQQFTRVSLTEFQLSIPLTAGKAYLFLPVNGDWNHKYGGTSATGGPILYDGAVPGSNTPAPATSGTYLIDVNFATGNYTLTKQ
jgi:starch-binding outer membrane protein SusE/F